MHHFHLQIPEINPYSLSMLPAFSTLSWAVQSDVSLQPAASHSERNLNQALTMTEESHAHPYNTLFQKEVAINFSAAHSTLVITPSSFVSYASFSKEILLLLKAERCSDNWRLDLAGKSLQYVWRERESSPDNSSFKIWQLVGGKRTEKGQRQRTN